MNTREQRSDLFARRLVVAALTLGLALVVGAVPAADGSGTALLAGLDTLIPTIGS